MEAAGSETAALRSAIFEPGATAHVHVYGNTAGSKCDPMQRGAAEVVHSARIDVVSRREVAHHLLLNLPAGQLEGRDVRVGQSVGLYCVVFD